MSLINGHSMSDKTMFGSLLNYKIQDWADAHRDIYIYDGGNMFIPITCRKCKE